MQLWVATGNAGKLRELRQLLEPHGYRVSGLTELAHPPNIIECGETFAENALIKARALYSLTGQPTLADDSGLVVDALGGAPGVHSARYAGASGAERDRANYLKLLSEMSTVPMERRAARFVCVLAYLDEHAHEYLFEGTCEGSIALRPQGDAGFGYDPIFWLPKLNKTMAQLAPAQKHALSHRGQAVQALGEHLRSCGRVR